MPEQPPPRAPSALTEDLHALAVAISTFDVTVSRRLEVSAHDYLAIKHLLDLDPPVGPVELGRLLGMSSGSATSLVDRLERDGHLERCPHPTDRRRRSVVVSATTRDAVLDALRPLAEAIDEVAAGLPVEQHDMIRLFLAELVRAHRDVDPTGRDQRRGTR